MAITGKTRSDSSADLRGISDDLFQKEKLLRKSMPGKGNGNVALVTFPDAIELIFALPGKVAKLVRKQAAGLFVEWIRDHTQDPALAALAQASLAAVDASPAVNLAVPSVDPGMVAGLRAAIVAQDAYVASAAPYVGVMQQINRARDDFSDGCPRFVSSMEGLHQAMAQRSAQLTQGFQAVGAGPTGDFQRALLLNDYMAAVAVDPGVRAMLMRCFERTLGGPPASAVPPPPPPEALHTIADIARHNLGPRRWDRRELAAMGRHVAAQYRKTFHREPGVKAAHAYEDPSGIVLAYSQAELTCALGWAREWVQASVGGQGIGAFFRPDQCAA